MLEVIVASGITAGNATLFIAQNGSISNFIQALAEL
jgi:sulfopyruvate decarboxylase TPP-binding subunit